MTLKGEAAFTALVNEAKALGEIVDDEIEKLGKTQEKVEALAAELAALRAQGNE